MSSIIYCFERATLLPEHLPLAAPEPAACSLGHAPLAVSPLTSLLAYGSLVRRGGPGLPAWLDPPLAVALCQPPARRRHSMCLLSSPPPCAVPQLAVRPSALPAGAH